jgi:hypothetical protein
MANHRDDISADNDAIDVLPLAIIPLATPALKRSADTGSGQVLPDRLVDYFEFDDRNQDDLGIVKNLSELPSYDVYSLRRQLRRLGIEIDGESHLQLSETKIRELKPYTDVFTKPLLIALFDRERDSVHDVSSVQELFSRHGREISKENLTSLANALNIDISDIPELIKDYDDIFLSLAFYHQSLDLVIPQLPNFLGSATQIITHRHLGKNTQLKRTISAVAKQLKVLATDTSNFIRMLENQTLQMWANLSGDVFLGIKAAILDNQIVLGGALCALTVKLRAWTSAFPNESSGGIYKRANFVMTEMKQGIDNIPSFDYPGLAQPT